MASKRDTLAFMADTDTFDLTSMIDVVFLLLIYFMYLPIQQEADIPFSLPADVKAQQPNAVLPSEQIVEIAPDGNVFLNSAPMDVDAIVAQGRDFKEFTELSSTLAKLRASASKSGVQTIVSIYPDADSPHQAAISVLDACAKAGITQVSFAEAD